MDDPFGVIYGLRSPSGKWYIGQTTYKINNYISSSYSSRKGKGRPYLNHAINKYGFELFQVFLLHEANSKEELDSLEISTIKHYKSNNNMYGYNYLEGGSCSKKPLEWKIHQSNIHKGKVFTEEHKKNISIGKLGLLATDEAKRNMSIARTGKKHSEEHVRNNALGRATWHCIVKDPNGIITTDIKSLADFCAKNNIQRKTLIRANYYKGWELLSRINKRTGEEMVNCNSRIIKHGHSEYKFTIKDPSGYIHENVYGLNSFAKNHGTNKVSINIGCKGWKILSKICLETGLELINAS